MKKLLFLSVLLLMVPCGATKTPEPPKTVLLQIAAQGENSTAFNTSHYEAGVSAHHANQVYNQCQRLADKVHCTWAKNQDQLDITLHVEVEGYETIHARAMMAEKDVRQIRRKMLNIIEGMI